MRYRNGFLFTSKYGLKRTPDLMQDTSARVVEDCFGGLSAGKKILLLSVPKSVPAILFLS